jgi:hypothetical protein
LPTSPSVSFTIVVKKERKLEMLSLMELEIQFERLNDSHWQLKPLMQLHRLDLDGQFLVRQLQLE